MINRNILNEVEELIYDGETLFMEAKKLIYENTYFISNDSRKNNKVFYKYFSPPVEFLENLDGVLSDIQSENDVVKLKAARFVRKESYKENSLSRYKWLTYPKTIDILLSSLNKNDDKKVTEEIILALGQIVERYEHPDLRIYTHVSSFFCIESKAIKNAVATTLSKFETPDKWKYILEIAENRPNKFGRELIVRIVRSDGATIPPSIKSRVRELIIKMKENNMDQKTFIEAAIDVLDGKEDKVASLFN